MEITLTDFLKNKEYMEAIGNTGLNCTRNRIVYYLSLPEFRHFRSWTKEKRERCRQMWVKTLAINNVDEFVLKLLDYLSKKDERIKECSRLGRLALKATNSLNMCYALNGDCSKCHYSHYESIAECHTYDLVKVLLSEGIELSKTYVKPDLNKYLYLSGKIDKL